MRGRVRVEPGAKRVRAYRGGELVADTTQPLYVWENRPYPAYWFPIGDVRTELLDSDVVRRSDEPELRDAIRLDWAAMDAWFEEDEEVFTHPRDPYTRIDALASSRHVRVEVDGVTVAESAKPTLLFETGLPTRYYLPKTDVRMDLLEHTDTVSHCPYKGQAEYWSVRIGEQLHPDLAWSYRAPFEESLKVAGLIAFYDEKVDVYVDGVLQERPSTKFA